MEDSNDLKAVATIHQQIAEALTRMYKESTAAPQKSPMSIRALSYTFDPNHASTSDDASSQFPSFLKQAQQHLAKAVDISRRFLSNFGCQISYLQLGELANMQGDFDSAVSYYKEALELSRLDEDDESYYVAKVGLGTAEGNFKLRALFHQYRCGCFHEIGFLNVPFAHILFPGGQTSAIPSCQVLKRWTYT